MFFRSSSHERVFRALRDDTDWFPHFDYEDPIQIGQIGTYDGKRCEFTWLHDLEKFGISVPQLQQRSAPPKVDRLFTHGAETAYNFAVEGGGIGKADFSFGSSGALATQSTGQQSVKCDIYALEKLIQAYLDAGKQWSRDWVVVTQVFPADSYTILRSKSRRASATIRTGVPITGTAFSIADPTLQLAATAGHGEMRQVIARQGVVPHFKIHKVKGWPPRSTSRFSLRPGLTLEPYGRER